MTSVRAAVPDDAPELVRLRKLMFDSMTSVKRQLVDSPDAPDAPEAWTVATEAILRKAAADPDGNFGIFVVDDAERPGRLAACAIGTLEQRLPAPGHPDGLFGFVFNVCTDPDRRLRGYARACTEALLAWFDDCGATRLDLHASSAGQELYRSLGFTEHSIALSRTRPPQA
jgi:ribosomal protein S18 acetylase RimI-like enzyme